MRFSYEIMSIPDGVESSFETMGKLYSGIGNVRSDFRNYNLMNKLSEFFKHGSVLDIGCGSGYLLNLLSRQKNFECYGIEPNKQMEKLLSQINPSIRIYSMWAEEIDTLDNSFDNISMIDVLEHIKNDSTQLTKIHNKLHAKGRLIIVVPAHKFLFGQRDKDMGHYRRYSKSELASKLSNSGFKIIKIRYWNALGFFPYYFFERILKKKLDTSLRESGSENLFKRILSKMMHLWFKSIENKISFGFGLSLLVVAEKM